MDYYDLQPGVYRIQAGIGSDGEIFGGIFLEDKPGILIGCSGGLRFVKAVDMLLDDLDFTGKIRVYLPVLTYEEVTTAVLLKKKFSNIDFHVHSKLVDELKQPRDNFGKERYIQNDETERLFSKNLPKEMDDVIGFDKGSSFETEKTKILIIPFDGPHKGHSFIYSRNHKLLCSGMIFGRTSNYRSYYLDLSGSIFQYENALSFVEGARSDLIFPIYDEPEFTKDFKFKATNLRDALEYDRNSILGICTSKFRSLDDITTEYVKMYGERFQTTPYNKVDLNKLRLIKHLDQLIEDKLVIKQEDQYRLAK